MTGQTNTDEMKRQLVSFLSAFDNYIETVESSGKLQYVTDPKRNRQLPEPEELRHQLQLAEPQVTDIVLKVLGDGWFQRGQNPRISAHNLIGQPCSTKETS